jgi:CMP-N-acetylneuraminic acid synthetase
MKILGIIPARAGSKGVPGKNSKLLNGKPLVQYSFDAANESKLLVNVVLSSDDENCIAFAKANHIETPFKRPDALATDTATSLQVIQHVIEFYRRNGQTFDIICLLQPTTPFRSVGFIDAAIKKFLESNLDSLFSVLEVPLEYNPHWVFEKTADGNLKIATGEKQIISRRQQLPQALHRDGAIYLVKTDVVMKENSLYGEKMGYIRSDPEYYVNIDTLKDWEKAEKIAKRFNSL